MDDKGKIDYGTSPFFELPPRITKELLEGKGMIELGDVMDNLIGEKNTKQKLGAVGYFTKGVMDRKRYRYYVDGLTVALIPFLNAGLCFEPQIYRDEEQKEETTRLTQENEAGIHDAGYMTQI